MALTRRPCRRRAGPFPATLAVPQFTMTRQRGPLAADLWVGIAHPSSRGWPTSHQARSGRAAAALRRTMISSSLSRRARTNTEDECGYAGRIAAATHGWLPYVGASESLVDVPEIVKRWLEWRSREARMAATTPANAAAVSAAGVGKACCSCFLPYGGGAGGIAITSVLPPTFVCGHRPGEGEWPTAVLSPSR